MLGLAVLLAAAIIVFFGGALADTIGLLVDAAHGGPDGLPGRTETGRPAGGV